METLISFSFINIWLIHMSLDFQTFRYRTYWDDNFSNKCLESPPTFKSMSLINQKDPLAYLMGKILMWVFVLASFGTKFYQIHYTHIPRKCMKASLGGYSLIVIWNIPLSKSTTLYMIIIYVIWYSIQLSGISGTVTQ